MSGGSWRVDADRAGLAGYHYFCRHTLRLDADPEKVRRVSCDENARRSIRHAERAGVVVRRAETEEDFGAFHRPDTITWRKHGMPPHPYVVQVAAP